ncbi:hypothetical protein H0W91_03410 [Patescibacteria group bacterium]|nr:hypothetical protein [Patescibacteria group bacterium]
MNFSSALPHGRAFEKEIFGITEGYGENLGFFRPPDKRDFFESLQDVITINWAMFAEAEEKGLAHCHNPSNPRMGRTHDLWASVKNYLPPCRRRQCIPLDFHVAIGRNSLDYHHGVDAFFWWQGAYVTIDVSLRGKDLLGTLKADILFTPKDLRPLRLQDFGKAVAKILVERSLKQQNTFENCFISG